MALNEKRFGPLPAAPAVEIGRISGKLTYTDTATHFGFLGTKVLKSDLAAACDCGEDDKCWAVPMSIKPWPMKLEACNRHGEPGHESHDSSHHRFTAQQLQKIGQLCVAAKKSAAAGKKQ